RRREVDDAPPHAPRTARRHPLAGVAIAALIWRPAARARPAGASAGSCGPPRGEKSRHAVGRHGRRHGGGHRGGGPGRTFSRTSENPGYRPGSRRPGQGAPPSGGGLRPLGLTPARGPRPPMQEPRIPYTRPWLTGREIEYVAAALTPEGLPSDGRFARACQERI